MIPITGVKDALKVDVAISQDMATALQNWALMYSNHASWLSTDIRSLNLPAAIASEISRAVTIEMTAEISGSARANYLAEQLKPVLTRIRAATEYGSAKGGLMFKPYVKGGNLYIDYVQADQFYPVAFDANQNITACVFSDVRTSGGKWYTRLEYHQMIDGGCQIIQKAYKSDTQSILGNEVPLSSVADWAELEQEALISNIDAPLFAYFRYPSANNIDPTSPLGVSCFARAVDQIEQADKIYSNLVWEFESGKRAIYADTQAFDVGSDGKPKLPDKRLYRALNGVGDIGQGGKLFEAWSPEFREAAIKAGLNDVLRIIEFNCGLAYGTLSDPNVEANTATEIKMQKQRSFATITDTQKALESALNQLLYAMDVWATLYNLAPRGTYKAVFSWDDSIVADHDQQFLQDQQVVTMSAMPLYTFLMRNYGLSETDAKKWVAEAQEEKTAAMDLFSTPAKTDPNATPDNPMQNQDMTNNQMMQDKQAA